MRLTLRSRLAAMALVILALAVIIVGAAIVTWRQVGSLRRHFSGVRIESFRIADYLQASVLNLNTALLRFVLSHDPSDWQKFSRNSENLAAWLRQQHPSTPEERQELGQVRTDLAEYRIEAQTIVAGGDIGPANALKVLSKIESASQQLLSLGYDLASASGPACRRVAEIAYALAAG